MVSGWLGTTPIKSLKESYIEFGRDRETGLASLAMMGRQHFVHISRGKTHLVPPRNDCSHVSEKALPPPSQALTDEVHECSI